MKSKSSQADAGFTLLELMITVAIVGLLAATAVPSFMHYIAKAKTTEATTQLEKIYNGARLYWIEPHGTAGSVMPLPAQFPDAAPATPLVSCCSTTGGRCLPESSLWQHATWKALGFSLDDPYYYQYEFLSGAGSFTARAMGNLDCDTRFSTFSMSGRIDPVSGAFGLAAVSRVDELE
jgi:prepilin-type N-terminal cleavage/methylation domain-containing protein